MKRLFAIFAISVFALLASACAQRVFGVDEAVWNTLNTQERDKVIDGYNKRKEIELANDQTRKEKELENERHRQEVDAQTAPFRAAADAISSVYGAHNKDNPTDSEIRIQSLSENRGRQTLTIADTQFDVSPLSKLSHAWVKGQKVRLLKNDDEFFYSVKIKNLDNGESVFAKKAKIY